MRAHRAVRTVEQVLKPEIQRQCRERSSLNAPSFFLQQPQLYSTRFNSQWHQHSVANPLRSSRPFSTTATCLKKGGKAAREEKNAQASTSSKSAPATDDPFDFAALEADINISIQKLKNDLSKLRPSGRFNPQVVEDLRVQIDKSSSQTIRLNDVAQVVPKGRQIHIMVGEKEHLKPTTTAIQSSGLNLTPQPDPTGTDPLLLVLNIPPPTAESRRAVVAEASKAGEKAKTSVHDARAKQQKRLRTMQLGKSARPDDLKKAQGRMEKVVEKGNTEVKFVVEAYKKILEAG